jgi:hypothetical protein
MGVSGGGSEQSFRLAELGVAEVIGNWPANRPAYERLRPFPLDTARIPWTISASRTGSYSGNVLRLSNTTFFVDIIARDSASRATQQRVSLVVRMGPLGTVTPIRSRGWTQLLSAP